MAFCTICGANVTGTFCSQCGTPVAAAGSPPPVPGAAVPIAQPAVRRTSPLVWVLVIVLGIFVLGAVGVIGVIGYVAHRVRQSVQVNGRDGGFSIKTRDSNGKDATIQFGGAGRVPSWIPSYPGSEGHTVFAVRGAGDSGEGGNFSFTTSDDVSKVKSYYSDKCRDLGMQVNLETDTADGGMMVAQDDGGDRRHLTVLVTGHGRDTTVNVTYGRK